MGMASPIFTYLIGTISTQSFTENRGATSGKFIILSKHSFFNELFKKWVEYFYSKKGLSSLQRNIKKIAFLILTTLTEDITSWIIVNLVYTPKKLCKIALVWKLSQQHLLLFSDASVNLSKFENSCFWVSGQPTN